MSETWTVHVTYRDEIIDAFEVFATSEQEARTLAQARIDDATEVTVKEYD